MSQQDYQQHIREALPQIFAYTLKRTNNRHEAEDLAQDIVVNLCSSASTLRDPAKFYAWMWGVADNVFKSHLRKKKRHNQVELQERDAPVPAPEAIMADKEQIGLLYREISLLSGLYREATVLYYIKGLSCEETAARLKISPEQVKQYLFKSRKKIREGMNQIRERGEGSFNPRKFNIYHWGLSGNTRVELFKRELPGNIMLETYYEPVTVEELSLELGISSVYLEDEIKILLKHDLLKLAYNNRYQANIVIFTREFEEELERRLSDTYADLANWLKEYFLEQEQELRQQGLTNLDQNTLLWQLASMCLTDAGPLRLMGEAAKVFPVHSDGSTGYMWGLERSFGDNDFDLGIHRYSDRRGNTVFLTDFFVLDKQHYRICRKPAVDILLKLAAGLPLTEDDQEQLPQLLREGYVLEGNVANLPVLTFEQYQGLKRILAPAEERIYSSCKEMVPLTQGILQNYVPGQLKAQVPVFAYLKQVEDCVVKTMNALYLDRVIQKPGPGAMLPSAYIVLAP